MAEINKNIKFTEEELEKFANDFEHEKFEYIPKSVLEILGDYYVQLVEKSVQTTNEMSYNGGIDSLTHGLCHMYEKGLMANELARPVGDILLDKLIEKAEQGYFSHANRSIDGYWQSVKNNPEAWKGLKAVLEKHPNYAFGQKYLGYMNGAVPETANVLAQRYLANPNMLFVTTTMVDVDGTLIQNGKANDLLIRELTGAFENIEQDFAIFTGGNPIAQKNVLVKAVAEKIVDKFALVKKEFSLDSIINMYSKDNEHNKALRENLLKIVYRDILVSLIIKYNIQTEQKWNEFIKDPNNQYMINDKYTNAKCIVEFMGRLMTKGDNQIKIYPKQAFVQDNICLCGAVIDDIQPQAQGIKSLTSAVLNPLESSFWATDTVYTGGKQLNIPNERKVTAEQVFAMYKQKNNVVDDDLIDKLIAAEESVTSFKELREKIDNIIGRTQ